MNTLATLAAAALSGHALPQPVVAAIAVSQVPGLNGSSASITLGYDVVKGGQVRRKVVAETMLPSADDAVALLADRDQLAAFVAGGLPAIPAAQRPQVPSWIADSRVAADRLEASRRARSLAERGMATVADLPFTA